MSKSSELLVKNIKRLAAKRSLRSFFDDSDLPHSTLSRIMNGKASPTLDTLDKIAEAFEVEPAELLTETREGKMPTDIRVGIENLSDSGLEAIRVFLTALNTQQERKAR